MNVVDSSGWIEYFVGGKHAGQFSGPIEDSETLIIPTIVVYEVFKYLLREAEEGHAWSAIAAMHAGTIVELNVDIALQAAQVSLQLRLPMADSIVLATARAHNAIFWTMDSDFRGMDGVKLVLK